MKVFHVRVSSKIRSGRQVIPCLLGGAISIEELVGRTRLQEMTQRKQEARSSLVIERSFNWHKQLTNLIGVLLIAKQFCCWIFAKRMTRSRAIFYSRSCGISGLQIPSLQLFGFSTIKLPLGLS